MAQADCPIHVRKVNHNTLEDHLTQSSQASVSGDTQRGQGPIVGQGLQQPWIHFLRIEGFLVFGWIGSFQDLNRTFENFRQQLFEGAGRTRIRTGAI